MKSCFILEMIGENFRYIHSYKNSPTHTHRKLNHCFCELSSYHISWLSQWKCFVKLKIQVFNNSSNKNQQCERWTIRVCVQSALRAKHLNRNYEEQKMNWSQETLRRLFSLHSQKNSLTDDHISFVRLNFMLCSVNFRACYPLLPISFE